MNDRFIVYGLVDPRDRQLRYVGKSCRGLKRARSHAYPGYLKRDRSHCGNWIKGLLAQGLRYEVVIIQKLQEPEILPQAEIFWISYFRQLRCPLTNLTLGGEGCVGRVVSAETREKMRKASLGNKNALGKKQVLTDEQRRALAARARIRSSDPLIRSKISATLSGTKRGPQSPETKAKISAAQLGHRKYPGSGRPKGTCAKTIQDTEGNLYSGLEAVAKQLGVTSSHICHVLKGRRPNPWGIKEI